MSAESPVVRASPPATVYPRKTRSPDWLTDLVLVITGVFGI